MATPTEFSDLQKATTADDATVHRVIGSVSPMKRGKSASYFEAKITDGKKQMLVVSFEDAVRRCLSSFQSSASAVSLSHIRIKRARDSDDLEVLLNSSTKLAKSPKKITVSSLPMVEDKPDNILLKDLPYLPTYTKVSFQAKVININKPEKVANGLTKQEVVVADSSAPARITLWENDVHILEKDQCYF